MLFILFLLLFMKLLTKRWIRMLFPYSWRCLNQLWSKLKQKGYWLIWKLKRQAMSAPWTDFKNKSVLKHLLNRVGLGIRISIIIPGNFAVGGIWIILYEASWCLLFSYRYCHLAQWAFKLIYSVVVNRKLHY